MALKCDYTRLIIPFKKAYADVAGNFAGTIAGKAGFDEINIRAIVECITKAVVWTVDYTAGEAVTEEIEISCELIPEGLKIIIKDKGLPFDPKFLTQDEPEGFQDILQFKEALDELSFHNLGPDGKELILIKYSKNKTLMESYAACELDFYKEPFRAQDRDFKTSGCTVRPMEPEDALEVSKCIYKGYGYSYAYDHVYYPEKLIQLNSQKKLFSVVALGDSGEIAGHCALHYSDKKGIAEMASGVVKPDYRAKGCFFAMSEMLVEQAKKDQLRGLFVQAVTNHGYSQQVASRMDLHECALILGYIPTSVNFRGIQNKPSQRISVLVYFMNLDKNIKPIIYPPEHHSPMILSLYHQLGIAPEKDHEKDTQSLTLEKESVIQLKVVNQMAYAQIKILTYGKHCVNEIARQLRQLCLKKLEVINLYVNLCNPLTHSLTSEFESLGFFFAGVLPGGMPEGDALILQYLNNTEIDYDAVQLLSSQAKQLLSYIKNLDPASRLNG